MRATYRYHVQIKRSSSLLIFQRGINNEKCIDVSCQNTMTTTTAVAEILVTSRCLILAQNE